MREQLLLVAGVGGHVIEQARWHMRQSTGHLRLVCAEPPATLAALPTSSFDGRGCETRVRRRGDKGGLQ